MRNCSPEYAQTFLSEMTEGEWQHLWNQVRLFAHKNYGWLQKIVSGLDIDVVIQEAIVDTYLGIRHWPVSDKHGNEVRFTTFICQTVRSKISHKVDQEKKKLSIDAALEKSESESPDSSLKELSVSPDHDKEIHYAQLCNKLIAIVHSNPVLTKIVALVIETPDIKPGEIAEILGLSESQVRNALKRLRRLARVLRKEW